MPSMSGKGKRQVITAEEEEDDRQHPNRCSPLGMNDHQSSTLGSCSPHRLKNIALSDMLSEFQDEGISSPPADLATFNSSEEASILYAGECMEMNNDILDLTKPLPWDRLKKGNSSMSLDSLNDNYIESQGDGSTEKTETNEDGEVCICGENVSPGCPVHQEKASLTEEIHRTCTTLVENLKVETPNDNVTLGLMRQQPREEDRLGDIFSSLESREFGTATRTRSNPRTLDVSSSCDKTDHDSYSTNSTTGSLKLDTKGSQSTDKDASSSNSSSGSFRSVPSVHKSDLSSSPESYDLLYKSFEVASMMEKENTGDEEEEDSPTVTPLEMFNRASPKLQKALTEKQRLALEGAHSENERNAAKESSGMCNLGLTKSANQPHCKSLDSDPRQKVTTFAQLAKTRKKPEIIQAPQTLTIKPTHWSELVANQEKIKSDRPENVAESIMDTPKRPHSLPIQLRFITKPASRPTQTPEQCKPVAGSVIRGVTRTLSAPEGFGADGMPIESQQMEMTRTTSFGQQSQSNAPTGNFTRFGMQKAASLPAPPPPSEFDLHLSTQFGGLQRSQPTREYSPSMDINANFTDDDLEGSISYNSPDSTQEEFRIHEFAQRQLQSPPSKPRRCVSWSDFPEGFQPSMSQNGMRKEHQDCQPSFAANTTTFRKMAATTSSNPPELVQDDTDYQCLKDMDSTPNWYRIKSATIGSGVSLRDLWNRVEEDQTDGYALPLHTTRNGLSTCKPVTTWAKTAHQQKILDIERNSVGCQVSDLPRQTCSPESFGITSARRNSFEAMLAENGLCCPEFGLNHHVEMEQNLSDSAPWFTRPRSKTFLSLHQDSVRTLQNVRSVKFEPRVKTWLVDCNPTKPSRVTCEDTFTQEQRPRRLVRIENITDASDVKYIRHRPLKPIHVVDAEYQRRKALQQLNALEAPSSAPPTVRYAPAFGKYIASDNYQSLPPNLERYRHWLNHSDGQSQLPKDTNQPMRERLASESAADMHRVYSGNEMQQSHMQERPHSLVLASYCDDGMEALPPQEIPVSPRYVSHHDTVDMLRKRALVAAIDGAVDHILGHFAHAINKSPLEKVRLGDSQQTPNVGHIVLHYLCPAITDLLLDGLKPHMQSFIVGRVKTTVWTPVEATTRLGPGTRSLYELVTALSKKRFLKEPSMKTNAFIFGLLNTRNVEVWLEHIRSHPDIVRTLYEPEAFLSLCNTSTRQLFDKLLLALQPLAILPFNLDYQFEYNYMQQHASAVREKQQLQEQHARFSSPARRESAPKEPRQSSEGGRTSGRFSSLLGRGAKKDFTRSNSWTSSLSSSLGFGKSFAGQSSGRGQHQSSEQSDTGRLLRTENTPPPKDTTQDKEVSSAESTPTSTQSWSLDWIKSFVAANDQSQRSRTVQSTTKTTKVTTTTTTQPANTGSSWSRFGASMFKAFDRMRQTEPQQQGATKQPELEKIEERPPSPPTTPSSPNLTESWNRASPGSPMKALCHHATMSPGELSFSKGDILTVDHQVDPDWILCHHGNESGLVHIDYVQGLE